MLKTWEDVKRDLDLVKENKNKSILLGNGFTTACINNKKFNSKKIIDMVHNYFKNRKTTKKITNIEDYIYEVEKQFIKQIYNLLPDDKIRNLPNLNNIISFLSEFDEFYTLNYDHILYCLLMEIKNYKITTDGFLPNNNGSLLIWCENNPQCVHYLHGAFHIKTTPDNKICKITRTEDNNLIQQIRKEWDNGNKSHIIIASDYRTKELKMSSEKYSPYLKYCFDKFKEVSGILVTMGVPFSASDTHIIESIKNNKKLEKIYIGYYNSKDLNYFQQIFGDIDKIKYYLTKDMLSMPS